MPEVGSVSVAFRLQRTVTEDAYVNVLVEPSVMASDGLDVEKLVAAALAMGRLPETEWRVEAQSAVSMHPTQTPRPQGR